MSGGPIAPAATCKDLLRTTDWTATPLGAYETWPVSLKSYVAMVLDMPTPAIIFWGPDQLQLYNDGYAVIMGPRHPRYFGAPYRECWPDTYPVIYPWMQRVLAGEVITVDRTLFRLTRHGFDEEAYFTFTFSPLRDDAGVICGILQPVVEMTADVLRMRRDQTLRELERGGDAGDVIERALAVARKNPHDIPSLRFLEGEAPSTEDTYVVALPRGGGTTTHGALAFGISPALRFDDAYRGFFASFAREVSAQLDVRAAREAEGELFRRIEVAREEAETARGRLQDVFMQAPLAIGILLGPEYEIALANPTICMIWARPLDAVLRRPLFEAIPELAGQGVRELLDHVRASRRPFVGTEIPMKFRRPGDDALEEVYFNFVYHPLIGPQGDVDGIIGLGVDVSMQVRARYAAEHLATDLDAARRDAEQARDIAQQANLAKDEFLAMLGHELRNPLAPIFTALEIMRMKNVGTGRELDVIERQSRHLGRLVDDLLDVSRIRSGKLELDRARLKLATVVAEAVETAAPLFEKRRPQLTVDIDDRLEVLGDRGRLTQVFANLLTNAAKFTSADGRIDVTARTEAGDVIVDVTDTGRGIAPEMLPRVFELFVQERQTIDRAQGGLGLGLTIVRTLVALHGGSVSVHSAGPGRGSTFTVRLPLAPPEVTSGDRGAGTARGDAVAGQPPGQRLLVVDDNEDAAALLADALSLAGHVCTVAHDGPAALAAASTSSFDAVLLDIGLPAMDGYEVARRLRALPGYARVPLLAITGYGQHSDQERAKQAGFDHHLVKPVNLTTLLTLLERTR